MEINWYPGHMAKAKREMQEHIRLIDGVIEVLDARAPLATRNPDLSVMLEQKAKIIILNKEDLAEEAETRHWVAYFANEGKAVPFCATKAKGKQLILQAIEEATAGVVARWQARGARKTLRIMVCGIPNVGKSSLINHLSGKRRTKIGSRPGVTKGKQWVRLTPYLELMDTPGILWPKLENRQGAKILAYLNAINDHTLPYEEVAVALGEELLKRDRASIVKRYGEVEGTSGREVLEAVARMRNFFIREELDMQKAASVLMEEFRSGKIGRYTLEHVGENDDE